MGSHQNEWDELARPLGTWIATSGCHLLTGAGLGVMTAVARAFCTVSPRRGLSLGIVPTTEEADGMFVPRPGYPNPWIEVPIVTPLSIGVGGSISRNHVNILSSPIIVALPGSSGTRDEVTLALKYKKPILCFGPANSFEDFPPAPTTTDFTDVERFLVAQLNLRVPASP